MCRILNAPLNVTLSLTPECNLCCKHCFAAKKAKTASYQMNLDEWKQVIDQLYENKVFRVLLSGGEPLVSEYFCELCEYLITKRINCSLNTNAILADKEMAGWMKRMPFRGRISVSLDGASKETHEFMRGENTYEKTLAGIHYLVREGLNVRLFFVVTKKNWKEIPDFVRLANELGCRQAYINEFYPIGRGADNAGELCLDHNSFFSALDLCGDLVEDKYKNFVSGTFISNLVFYKTLLKRDASYHHETSACNGCGNGMNSLVINYDKTTAPCEMLLETDCGDILSDGLAKIWKESKVLNYFRQFRDTPVSALEGCSACRINDICDGGCRALPYLQGDFCGKSICYFRDR